MLLRYLMLQSHAPAMHGAYPDSEERSKIWEHAACCTSAESMPVRSAGKMPYLDKLGAESSVAVGVQHEHGHGQLALCQYL